MSGDVQPRKRKDKKRKKDELGLEEGPRGTAAALGDGDVFMHSPHDHGTGGHWCAKIIFFSLLAILITLIGLIILENRGLSELEANAVESRYSGVLEGWLEDAPDDDHHDEHTLELTHHDDDDDGHDEEADQGIEHEHDEEDEHDEDDDHNDEDEDENAEEDEDENAEKDEEDNSDEGENGNDEYDNRQSDEDVEHDELDQDDDNKYENNYDQGEEDDSGSQQNDEDDDEHDEEEHDEVDEEVEVEKLEKEINEAEPISVELPALSEDDDDDNDQDASEDREEPDADADDDSDNEEGDEDEEFLEADDDDEPPIERITVPPPGKPFVEVEEEDSSEQPPNTLDEEEEYEKRQEELRKEEAQSSHMWLKLTVGGALLVATHAVMRRASRSRDESETEDHASREETPVVDRRMTLLPEQHSVPARKVIEQVSQPGIEKVVEKISPIVKSIPIKKQQSEEEEEEDEEKQLSEDEEIAVEKDPQDKELYSDEGEAAEEVEEEEEEEEIVVPKKEAPKQTAPPAEKKPEPESEEEIEEDVEIIGDEQLEEELEEEDEDEEEISDVDDAELLSRLEAKYGRLPEPERPGQKHKDGGNSLEDAWPGEPADAYWRRQLDSAERELHQGAWTTAGERAGATQLRDSARARYIVARALDAAAEAKRDNRLLSRAIAAYLDLLKMNERLSDKKLIEVTGRTLDRIQFRGNYLNAEPVYRLLIRRFPNEPSYRNNLTISFLMANRADLAEEVLKETLKRWPDDRIALAHYAFVLKTKHNQYEKAVELFEKALEGDTGPANEARFYYHYGDSLLLLGRPDEAHEVHKRGAKLSHFLSPSQRSLYNVPRLKSSPWWNIEDTPYLRLAKALEKSWKEILKEGEAARALYEQEKEGLKERGEWSQLDLFVRGQDIPGRCDRAPVTCGIVRSEPAAAGCRRGQVKFSSMAAGTHVRAHVGPTNCRLRMHLGLSNTKDTYIRVDKEIRQWQAGKVFMFDDSFEHEVWHNGTGTRLVLIVDVWHPQLTPAERRSLPAI